MSFVFVTVTPRYLNFPHVQMTNFQLLYFDFVVHFDGGTVTKPLDKPKNNILYIYILGHCRSETGGFYLN